jgi:hypothetical protein
MILNLTLWNVINSMYLYQVLLTIYREKTFISRSTINDIKRILLEPNVHDIRDARFRSWARNSFKILSIGSNHFVCERLSNRRTTSIRNNNREIMDLPVLAKEDMYYEFCSTHDAIIHGGQRHLLI